MPGRPGRRCAGCDVAQFTTLGLLLFSLTGSGLGVSGAVVAEIIPVLLLAAVAGALVDRLPLVRVMVGATWRGWCSLELSRSVPLTHQG